MGAVTPTLDGAPIFGSSVSLLPEQAPREVQINSYFGLNGVERLDGGDRGGKYLATGVLSGTGYPGLVAAQALFAGFRDGLTHTLIDTAGRLSNQVVLDWFRAKGRIRRDTSGVWAQEYEAELIVLGPNR